LRIQIDIEDLELRIRAIGLELHLKLMKLLIDRYPIGVTLIQSLFSKILGARPQGTWMGTMLAFSCLPGIIGEKWREGLHFIMAKVQVSHVFECRFKFVVDFRVCLKTLKFETELLNQESFGLKVQKTLEWFEYCRSLPLS
jgi:hypothetical protein